MNDTIGKMLLSGRTRTRTQASSSLLWKIDCILRILHRFLIGIDLVFFSSPSSLFVWMKTSFSFLLDKLFHLPFITNVCMCTDINNDERKVSIDRKMTRENNLQHEIWERQLSECMNKKCSSTKWQHQFRRTRKETKTKLSVDQNTGWQ